MVRWNERRSRFEEARWGDIFAAKMPLAAAAASACVCEFPLGGIHWSPLAASFPTLEPAQLTSVSLVLPRGFRTPTKAKQRYCKKEEELFVARGYGGAARCAEYFFSGGNSLPFCRVVSELEPAWQTCGRRFPPVMPFCRAPLAGLSCCFFVLLLLLLASIRFLAAAVAQVTRSDASSNKASDRGAQRLLYIVWEGNSGDCVSDWQRADPVPTRNKCGSLPVLCTFFPLFASRKETVCGLDRFPPAQNK